MFKLTVLIAGLQHEFYGDMFLADWNVPKFDLNEARNLLKQANYKGEVIPYQLLNNYYTNQTPGAQVLVEGWRAAGAEISFFSPLGDGVPDAAADAVYLPGGYPELHAGRLAGNRNFLDGLLPAAAQIGRAHV